MLDFSLPPAVIIALVCVLALPAALAVIARIPRFRGRNPVQFLMASFVSGAGWGFGLFLLHLFGSELSVLHVALSAMLLASGLLFLLEAWALLSRGYTLQMLLTLHQARRPLTPGEIASSYRSGEGIDWIFNHRISGLIAAGMVQEDGTSLRLTRIRGTAVAWVYKLTIRILGLGKTG